MRAQLASETDLEGFRAQARKLIALGIAPDNVEWSTQAGSDDLFSGAPVVPEGATDLEYLSAPRNDTAAIRVPQAFVDLCETVVLHRDPQRFALLYRLLWRLQRELQLRHDALDADMLLARQMAQAVGHDIHKMRAFVRFREVADAQGTLHVAWFEPAHHIVEANAPWFARRFAQMRWAILTPDRCVSWDGHALGFRPGAQR
jgi:DNA polymerase